VPPQNVYYPRDGASDPDLLKDYDEMASQLDPVARQAAFAHMQKTILERVYAVPFGSLTKVQATRSNVKGFKPFRIPRFSNVWIDR
jgi:peptide/nickel transport system substrate-binding protein